MIIKDKETITKEILASALEPIHHTLRIIVGKLGKLEEHDARFATIDNQLLAFRGEFNDFKLEMREFKNEMYDFKDEMYLFRDEMYIFRDRTDKRFERVFETDNIHAGMLSDHEDRISLIETA